MSDKTPNLDLPYIAASQAQKHITHNDALYRLDALVQLCVLDRILAAPPASPAEDDRHIVAAGASGEWAGHEDEIAAFQDGGWIFFAPHTGWRAWVADESVLIAWDGTAWTGAGGEAVNPAPLVGVNATADATNRLSVKSDAVLISHDDVTPGSGDQRTILNKAGAANTASLLFQTGYSARAECGLTGDEDFHLKVSADGTAFNEGIIVDKDTGDVTVGRNFLISGNRMHTKVDGANFFWYGTDGGSEPTNLIWSYKTDGASVVLATTFRAATISFTGITTTANAANAFLDSASGNRLYRSTSRRAWKRDIEPLEEARAEALMGLEPVWYRSACPDDDPAWSWYGFIAEDVARIDPRMVHWGYSDEDLVLDEATHSALPKSGAERSPQGVAYERFVVHHHLLIKRLMERVAELETAGKPAARP